MTTTRSSPTPTRTVTRRRPSSIEWPRPPLGARVGPCVRGVLPRASQRHIWRPLTCGRIARGRVRGVRPPGDLPPRAHFGVKYYPRVRVHAPCDAARGSCACAPYHTIAGLGRERSETVDAASANFHRKRNHVKFMQGAKQISPFDTGFYSAMKPSGGATPFLAS
eukprot:5890940-Prymnesium_polylepis.1